MDHYNGRKRLQIFKSANIKRKGHLPGAMANIRSLGDIKVHGGGRYITDLGAEGKRQQRKWTWRWGFIGP